MNKEPDNWQFLSERRFTYNKCVRYPLAQQHPEEVWALQRNTTKIKCACAVRFSYCEVVFYFNFKKNRSCLPVRFSTLWKASRWLRSVEYGALTQCTTPFILCRRQMENVPSSHPSLHPSPSHIKSSSWEVVFLQDHLLWFHVIWHKCMVNKTLIGNGHR